MMRQTKKTKKTNYKCYKMFIVVFIFFSQFNRNLSMTTTFALAKLWNVLPKDSKFNGVDISVELDIHAFIDNFIIKSVGNVTTKLELINIMFGRWKCISMEICIENCRHFLQVMDELYPDRTSNHWNGCVCNVKSYDRYFITHPKWSEKYDNNYPVECEEMYWVNYHLFFCSFQF